MYTANILQLFNNWHQIIRSERGTSSFDTERCPRPWRYNKNALLLEFVNIIDIKF